MNSGAVAPLQIEMIGLDQLAACQSLRRSVFVLEQGVPEELEVDGRDGQCTHFAARSAGELIGTARMRIVDGAAKAERVAVARSHRGQGVGAALMHALEDHARAAGFVEVWLASQVSALRFYRLLGYRARGGPFLEAGIEHVSMYKPLEKVKALESG